MTDSTPNYPLPDLLEDLARQMRSGDYTLSSAAVLLTRCADSGIMTIVPWGSPSDTDALMVEAGGTRVDSLREQ